MKKFLKSYPEIILMVSLWVFISFQLLRDIQGLLDDNSNALVAAVIVFWFTVVAVVYSAYIVNRYRAFKKKNQKP